MIGKGWTFGGPTLASMTIGLVVFVVAAVTHDLWLAAFALFWFAYHLGAFVCDRLVASRPKEPMPCACGESTVDECNPSVTPPRCSLMLGIRSIQASQNPRSVG